MSKDDIRQAQLNHLAKSFALHTEASTMGANIKERKQPKILRPSLCAVAVRCVLMLPAIPSMVVYTEHNRPIINVLN